jgi:hypothetical protein
MAAFPFHVYSIGLAVLCAAQGEAVTAMLVLGFLCRFAPVLLLPLFATILFQRSVHALFSRPWEAVSLRDARDLDAAAEQKGEVPPLLTGGASDAETVSGPPLLIKGVAAAGFGETAAAYWPPEERLTQDHDMVRDCHTAKAVYGTTCY